MKHVILSAAALLLASPATQAATFSTPITETKITANDAERGDRFGHSVGISGTTAIVGAYSESPFGSAYLFDTTTGSQFLKLTANDGATGDRFGHSVAISGTTAIVGDIFNNRGRGAAYLFDTTTGTQIAKLTITANTTEFGNAVAISGNRAIVGSFREASDTGVWNTGSAYLFDATSGAQIARLVPDDIEGGDNFGASVAISGNTAIVGSPFANGAEQDTGAAYLFDVTTGTQIAKLTVPGSEFRDFFGVSVAIEGDTAIVGAYGEYGPNTSGFSGVAGAAYLFDVPTRTLIARLTAEDTAGAPRFGSSVAISGNTAIVGAYLDDDRAQSAGSAYLFDATTGARIAKLTASDAEETDFYGFGVAISGTTAIVGAQGNNDAGASTGSAYLYTASSAAPVPLPAGAWLLIGALGGLGLLRRRAAA